MAGFSIAMSLLWIPVLFHYSLQHIYFFFPYLLYLRFTFFSIFLNIKYRFMMFLFTKWFSLMQIPNQVTLWTFLPRQRNFIIFDHLGSYIPASAFKPFICQLNPYFLTFFQGIIFIFPHQLSHFFRRMFTYTNIRSLHKQHSPLTWNNLIFIAALSLLPQYSGFLN